MLYTRIFFRLARAACAACALSRGFSFLCWFGCLVLQLARFLLFLKAAFRVFDY